MNHENIINEQPSEELNLRSTNGLRLLAFAGKINTSIKIFKDRIQFNVYPKRLNHHPEVYIDDIDSVERGIKIAIAGYIYAILGIILTFFYVPIIISIPVVLWLFSNTTVTIKLKNGEAIKIYSANKKMGIACYESLQKIINQKAAA